MPPPSRCLVRLLLLASRRAGRRTRRRIFESALQLLPRRRHEEGRPGPDRAEGRAANADNFAKWVKVHDRSPPARCRRKKKPRPPAADTAAATKWLHDVLVAAEDAATATGGGPALRRLTRVEYENTRPRPVRPARPRRSQGDLPADGSAHGFDNNGDALDISHVNLAKYLEAADRALDMAIATRPDGPEGRSSSGSRWPTRTGSSPTS